jgi:hypothetical protein
VLQIEMTSTLNKCKVTRNHSALTWSLSTLTCNPSSHVHIKKNTHSFKSSHSFSPVLAHIRVSTLLILSLRPAYRRFSISSTTQELSHWLAFNTQFNSTFIYILLCIHYNKVYLKLICIKINSFELVIA